MWLMRSTCVTLAKHLTDSCEAFVWLSRSICSTLVKHLSDSYEAVQLLVRSTWVAHTKHFRGSCDESEWLVRSICVTPLKQLCDSCFVLKHKIELFESLRRSRDAHNYFSANQIASNETSNWKKCAVERHSVGRAIWARKSFQTCHRELRSI